MARLGDKADLRGSGAADAIAAGAFSREDSLRGAAVSAAATLSTHVYKRTREALPVPDGPLTLRDVLLGLAPDEAGPAERAAALIALRPGAPARGGRRRRHLARARGSSPTPSSAARARPSRSPCSPTAAASSTRR